MRNYDNVPRLLLRPDEAAVALGICRAEVYKLLQKGTIPSIKIGTSRRVVVKDLEAFIEERTEEQRKNEPQW